MSTEVSLAAIAVIGSLVAGLVYAMRKWADAKERQSSHEIAMQEAQQNHEREMEKRRSDRDIARMERDLKTVEYIQSNTHTIKALAEQAEKQTQAIEEMRKAIQAELGNGVTGLLRDLTERSSRTSDQTAYIIDALGRIETRLCDLDKKNV